MHRYVQNIWWLTFYITASIDINECDEENGGCSHMCNNTIGSYQCLCEDGYELDSDQHLCNGNVVVVPPHTLMISLYTCIIYNR